MRVQLLMLFTGTDHMPVEKQSPTEHSDGPAIFGLRNAPSKINIASSESDIQM